MSDNTLIDTLTAAAEELEEAEKKADIKSAELALLRDKLWKLLGPIPSPVTIEGTLESTGCSNCTPVGKSALLKELDAICKNISAGHNNAAWGRAATLITMIREGGCRAG